MLDFFSRSCLRVSNLAALLDASVVYISCWVPHVGISLERNVCMLEFFHARASVFRTWQCCSIHRPFLQAGESPMSASQYKKHVHAELFTRSRLPIWN